MPKKGPNRSPQRRASTPRQRPAPPRSPGPSRPRPTPEPGAGFPLTRPGLILGALLIAAIVVALIANSGDDTRDLQSGVGPPAGVQTFKVSSRGHVPDPVEYPQTPPVGGDHNPVWVNCGFHDEAVVTETGVHSMEHGAVWLAYAPDLPDDQLETLRSLGDEPYVLVTKWRDSDLPAPIVASAWGAQLQLDDATDPAIDQFLDAYRQAASAPEPGAPCTGGVDASGR